ncbi:MAG: tetratricopeptide repeat protein [Methanococcaceae archaeon]
MYKKTILFLLCALFYIGCASDKLQRSDSSDTDSTEQVGGGSQEAMEHFIQGNLADAKGDYAGAILEYQDAIKLDPKAGVYYALGKDYLQLNKLSLALDNVKLAVSLDSGNVDYYNLLAEIYTNAHQTDSAALAYEKIIRLDPNNINAYYNLGSLYEKSKPLQALGVYNKLLELIGPEWSVLARVAELNEHLGNTDAAIKAVEQLLLLDPSNVDLKKLLIDSYSKTQNYEKALEIVNDLQSQYPQDRSLMEIKGDIYMQKDDWKSASKQFHLLLADSTLSLEQKIKVGTAFLNQSTKDSTYLPEAREVFIKLDKDTVSWQVKMILGEIALRQRDDKGAIEYFKTVTELAKWNAEAYIRLGGLYFDNKKYSEAAQLLEEAVTSFPDNFPINLILGLSFSQLNDYQKAKTFLGKAVSLNSKDITALSAYGYTLNQLKQPEEAINYIKQALQIDPVNVDLLGTLGLIFNAQKRWAECDSCYSKALELDSTNILVLNNYAYSLAERGVRLDEALNMVTTALNKEPSNSSYLDTMGWVYFRLGKFKLAADYIQKALNIDSKNSTLLEHLGDITFKEGDKSKAIDLWKKALELNSDNPELKSKIEKGEL